MGPLSWSKSKKYIKKKIWSTLLPTLLHQLEGGPPLGTISPGCRVYIYTVLRICSTPTFSIFSLSGFEREPLKLHKQMIPHCVALDVSYIIFQVRLCSCIRGCHATFLLKNTLFKGEVAWQPQKEQQSCSPNMLEAHIRAFKWGIVCFSTIIPCKDISDYIQKRWFYLVKKDIFRYKH